MKVYIFLMLFFSASLTLFSQAIYIDNETDFRDGIYTSYEDFINNEPSLPFSAFDIKWVSNPFFNKMKIQRMKNYQDGKLKHTDMTKVWGFCIGGVPYIQYSITLPYKIRFGNQASAIAGKSSFSRLRILGNICHLNIEDHLPKGNSRFNKSLIRDEIQGRTVRVQKLMKLNTGKVYDYDEYILSQLMKDDEQLVASFKKEENREVKMFNYLTQYNKRNPVLNKTVIASNK